VLIIVDAYRSQLEEVQGFAQNKRPLEVTPGIAKEMQECCSKQKIELLPADLLFWVSLIN